MAVQSDRMPLTGWFSTHGLLRGSGDWKGEIKGPVAWAASEASLPWQAVGLLPMPTGSPSVCAVSESQSPLFKRTSVTWIQVRSHDLILTELSH